MICNALTHLRWDVDLGSTLALLGNLTASFITFNVQLVANKRKMECGLLNLGNLLELTILNKGTLEICYHIHKIKYLRLFG